MFDLHYTEVKTDVLIFMAPLFLSIGCTQAQAHIFFYFNLLLSLMIPPRKS
jgi:hypothetical protein